MERQSEKSGCLFYIYTLCKLQKRAMIITQCVNTRIIEGIQRIYNREIT